MSSSSPGSAASPRPAAWPPCPVIPVRFVVVACLCLAAIATNDLLSAVIVAMVRQPPSSPALPVHRNDSRAPLCPAPDHNDHGNGSKWAPEPIAAVVRGRILHGLLSLVQVRDDGPGFDWSLETQGMILGSYYWLFVLVLLPVGVAADRGSSSLLLSTSLLLTGLLFLVSPIAAQTSAWLLVLVRVGLGACSAVLSPCSYVLLCNWSPACERSVLLTIVVNISSLSSILFLLLTGPIVQQFSWSGMFYIPAAVCILSFLLVAPMLRERPESHFWVTPDELAYIRAPAADSPTDPDQGPLMQQQDMDEVSSDGSGTAHADEVSVRERVGRAAAVPWFGILCNPSVLTVILFKFAYSLSCAVLTSEAPTLLTSLFQMPVGEVSQVMATCSALYMVSAILMSKLSEELISRSVLTRTGCRKLFSLFTGAGSAVTAGLIPVLGCRADAVVGLILVNNVMQSGTVASDMTLPAEMTNRFPGLLFSVCTVSSVLAYLTGPTMAGAMLQLVLDRWTAWSLIFGSTSGLLLIANLFFLLFASAEVQAFDQVAAPVPAAVGRTPKPRTTEGTADDPHALVL